MKRDGALNARLVNVLPFPGWNATLVPPQSGDWIVGDDGIITCSIVPESAYTKYNNVEWTYQAPNTTSFKQVYFYLPDGRNASHEHLTDRATHKQTGTQMKLIIRGTKPADDGIYRGTIQGPENTATCEVSYVTRSKVYISYL